MAIFRYTWARSFLDMLKELHDLAGQHEVIAENIQGQLVQEAQKLVSDMKNERKKVKEQKKNCREYNNLSVKWGPLS